MFICFLTLKGNIMSSSIPVLSEFQNWEFFAEGAANIIYKYNTHGNQSDRFNGKLLRLRKKINESPTTLEIHEFLHRKIVPVLNDYCINMELVELTDEFKIGLQQLKPDGKQRLDAPIDDKEKYGFLMDSTLDLHKIYLHNFKIGAISYFLGYSPLEKSYEEQSNSNNVSLEKYKYKEVVIEFKPKWLLPSPNTIDQENCVRCRTCALSYQRKKKLSFCPLDLVSFDNKSKFEKVILDAFGEGEAKITELLQTKNLENNIPMTKTLSKLLYKSPLLESLKRLQALDKKGILGYNPGEKPDDDFLVATAARDCTFFISIEKADEKNLNTKKNQAIIEIDGNKFKVTTTVTDVDIKNPSKAKLDYWRKVESTLLNEGWYTNASLPPCNYYLKKSI